MAEWSKAPDSSSGPRKRAWVQTPLLTYAGGNLKAQKPKRRKRKPKKMNSKLQKN
ncbi:unnamed protein product [Arabidopsis lyrata]|uniref:Uncharacterized protein n=1 Tax=Arabidopsis lyrata subsp. lyrata TaxID=81972 RepID=D7MIT5_ARALL|nr:hypothetical protein ARALYDRAFT_916046 [Arabidopsis lyrata subsp. lyrata]CAH8277807.1 unnamed protein product [Arabidopsis lyrata]